MVIIVVPPFFCLVSLGGCPEVSIGLVVGLVFVLACWVWVSCWGAKEVCGRVERGPPLSTYTDGAAGLVLVGFRAG